MGKGRGKGGCGIFEQIGDCIQCIAGCICCLVCSGPICIIIGIVLIVTGVQDSRSERIDDFKVTVGAWRNGNVDQFADSGPWTYTASDSCAAGGAVGPRPLSKQMDQAEDLGAEAGESDFAGYTPVLFSDDSPPALGGGGGGALSGSCTLTFNIRYAGSSIGEITTPRSIRVVEGYSDLCGGAGTSSSSSRVRRDIQQCAQVCQRQGGTASGSSLSYSSFQCVTETQPAAVCTRVARSGNTFTIATSPLPDAGVCEHASCTADATRQGSTAVAQRLLPELWCQLVARGADGSWRDRRRAAGADPYLYFLDISDGTKDFGLTRGEALSGGFALIAIGAVITALMCLVCFCIVKMARGIKSGKQERPQNPVLAPLYDVSAKYGQYIPGGASAGPSYQGKPPAGYPGDPEAAGGGYNQGGYNNQQGGYGGPNQPPPPQGNYGGVYNAAPYGGQPQGGGAPPGYPSAV